MLRFGLGAVGPEQPGDGVAMEPIAPVGEMDDQVARQAVRDVMALAILLPARRAEQLQLGRLAWHGRAARDACRE